MWRQPSYGRTLAGVLLLTCWLPAQAQEPLPDSTRVRADTLVSPFGTESGRAFGDVPYTSSEVDGQVILEQIPGAFLYDFGDAGWPDGLSLDGQSPAKTSLALDDLPFNDLFTERPHAELLPAAALGRFRLGGQSYGRVGGLNAYARPFFGGPPITELKFETGQEGLQYVSATHAQTHTPPGLLGGRGGRLGVMGHVSGTKSDGQFAGRSLRAWEAFGRISLSRPGFAASLTEFHTKHTVGASTGVEADFPAAYYPAQAIVLDPSAKRETVRNDLALNVRVPFGVEAFSTTAYWTRQHERYTPTGIDTSLVRGNRFGGSIAVPFRIANHRFHLGIDGWWDDAPGGQVNPFTGIQARTQIHATLADSLDVSGWGVNAEAGVHSVGGSLFPSGHLRVGRGIGYVMMRYAGHVPGRVESTGYAGLITGLADESTERIASAEAGVEFSAGSLNAQLRGFASLATNPRVLVGDGIGGAAYTDLTANMQRAGGSFSIEWRMQETRGVYASGNINGMSVLNPNESELFGREADAAPAIWATGQLGVRADGLFDNNLALDIAARGRAWSAFRSRTFIPAPALFALPVTASPETPASGVLDLVLGARLQRRATLFVLYENVLATRTYDGVYIVPVYPFPAHRVRFGIIWTLFG